MYLRKAKGKKTIKRFIAGHRVHEYKEPRIVPRTLPAFGGLLPCFLGLPALSRVLVHVQPEQQPALGPEQPALGPEHAGLAHVHAGPGPGRAGCTSVEDIVVDGLVGGLYGGPVVVVEVVAVAAVAVAVGVAVAVARGQCEDEDN